MGKVLQCVTFVFLFMLFCAPVSADTFLHMDAPTLEFTVENLDYKTDLDVFVQQGRKVWLPLGELWFWATPKYIEDGDIELVIEMDGQDEISFVFPSQGGDRRDFWEAENHIFVRLKIMHSDCFHGAYEVEENEPLMKKTAP